MGSSLLLWFAALAGGVVNALAGGGTLLTFPSLLAVGVAPVAANGTSTAALLPGSALAFWGYRRDVQAVRWVVAAILLPSLAGGVLGALWVAHLPDATFRAVVPWLILAATGLFVGQGWIRSRLKGRGAKRPGAAVALWLIPVELVVATYGGFFGAGLGILQLATLELAGFHDIHEMNGLKTLAAFTTNGVAALTFLAAGKVVPALALWMALAAALGGLLGPRLARRMGPRWVRRFVVVCGVVIGLFLLLRR